MMIPPRYDRELVVSRQLFSKPGLGISHFLVKTICAVREVLLGFHSKRLSGKTL